MDSNHGPLVLQATALPTEPQPLPKPLFTSSNFGKTLLHNSSDTKVESKFDNNNCCSRRCFRTNIISQIKGIPSLTLFSPLH